MSIDHEHSVNQEPIDTELSTVEVAPKKTNKRRMALIGASSITAIATGAAIIGGTILSPKGENGAEHPNKTLPTDKQSSQTVETPAPSETVAPVSLEIKSGLSAKEYATDLLSTLSGWNMAGTTPEFQKKWLRAGDTSRSASDQLTRDLAATNTNIYASALFVDNWQNHDDINNYVDKQQAANFADITDWVLTYNSGQAADIEPWNESETVDSAHTLSTDKSGRTIGIDATLHNNADKNRMGQVSPDNLAGNGRKVEYKITTQVNNNVEKISSISVVALK